MNVARKFSIRSQESNRDGGIFYAARFQKKIMIDRGLESDSAPYKLTIKFFFMSYAAQLEAETSIWRWMFLKKYINPVFLYQKNFKWQKLHTIRNIYSKVQVNRIKLSDL